MSNPLSAGLKALGYNGGATKAVSGVFAPMRAYGGSIATGAGAAALGTAALVTDSIVNGGNAPQPAAEVKVPEGANALPSAQHLEAPLNGIITAWLEQNAPTVDALFKVTGLKPLQLVDRLVTGLFNRGVPATAENINSVALDIMDSANERAALRHDNFEHKEGQVLNVIDPDSQAWSNTKTAVAAVETAASLFPTGIHGIIALREVLYMNPQDFDAAVRHIYLRDLNAEYGDTIQDRSQRVRVRL